MFNQAVFLSLLILTTCQASVRELRGANSAVGESGAVSPDQRSGAFPPPPVPPRLPLLPAFSPARAPDITPAKPSLAWRAKAHELKNNKLAASVSTSGDL